MQCPIYKQCGGCTQVDVPYVLAETEPETEPESEEEPETVTETETGSDSEEG